MRRFNRNLYKSERREREKVYSEEIMEMIKKKKIHESRNSKNPESPNRTNKRRPTLESAMVKLQNTKAFP